MGREERREGVIPRKKEPLDYGCGRNYREKPGGETQTEITGGESANFGTHLMWLLASQRGRSHGKEP